MKWFRDMEEGADFWIKKDHIFSVAILPKSIGKREYTYEVWAMAMDKKFLIANFQTEQSAKDFLREEFGVVYG